MMQEATFLTFQHLGKDWRGPAPDRNRELTSDWIISAESLDREILSHDFDSTYERNLTCEEQKALDVLGYDYIIIKQADKGSAVPVIDKEAYSYEKHCRAHVMTLKYTNH